MRHKGRIFSADSAGWNAGGVTVSGVRQPVIGATKRADERGRRSEVGGGFRTSLAVTNGFAVGGSGHSRVGLLLVELLIEQDDPARDPVASKRVQFSEVVDHDQVGGDSIGTG